MGGHARRGARRDAPRGGHAHARDDRGIGERAHQRGRQAAGREPRRGGLDRGRLRLLRGDGAQLRGAGDPLDRGHPARPGHQGAHRCLGRHRALELPAAAPVLEARSRARGGQHGGGQAVGGHAAVDPDARRVLCRPGPGGGQHRGRSGRRGRRHRRGRAHRRRGLHGLGGNGQEGRGHVRAAGGAHEPRDGRQGSVHRVRRRRRRRGGGGQGRRLGGLPQRGPGVHLGRALLRAARDLRRLRQCVRRPGPRAARGRSLRREHRRGADGLRPPAGQGRGPARAPRLQPAPRWW